MNEIDLIIIVNLLGLLVFLFLIYKGYKLYVKKYGKMIALLFPLSLLGFLGSIGQVTKNDVKSISKEETSKILVNSKTAENNEENPSLKRIDFSKDASLFQKLHFSYEIEQDSLTKNYGIKKVVDISFSGITSNLEWKNDCSNMAKINDSIYEFKVVAYYRTKILFLVMYNGEKEFTKRININNYH